MRVFSLFVILSVLSACQQPGDPSFMPAGYTYHHKVYKSPSGAPAYPPEEEVQMSHPSKSGWRSAPDDSRDYNG